MSRLGHLPPVGCGGIPGGHFAGAQWVLLTRRIDALNANMGARY